VILRELIARVKFDAKGAKRELGKFDKLLDEVAKGLGDVQKESDDAGEAAKKGGKKASDAAREQAKAEREKKKAVREAAKAAKQAAREAKKQAREAEIATRKQAKAEAKLAADRTKRAKKRKQDLKDFGGQLANLAKGAAAGTAAGVAALAGVTTNFAKTGGDLTKQAAQFNIPVDELQRLSGAAKLAKVDQDELLDSVKEFGVKLDESEEDGVTPFSLALGKMGLAVEDFKGLKFEDTLKKVAGGLGTLGPEVNRTRVLMEIFGEEAGVRLAPLLDGGAEKIDKLIGKYIEFGGVLSGEAIERSKELNTQLNETGVQVNAIALEVGDSLAPEVTKMLKEFRKWLGANKELRRQQIVKFFKQFIAILKDAVPLVVDMTKATLDLVESVGGIEPALLVAATGFAALHAAALGPIGLIGVAIAGLVGGIAVLDRKLTASALKARNLQEAARNKATEGVSAGDRRKLQRTPEGRALLAESDKLKAGLADGDTRTDQQIADRLLELKTNRTGFTGPQRKARREEQADLEKRQRARGVIGDTAADIQARIGTHLDKVNKADADRQAKIDARREKADKRRDATDQALREEIGRLLRTISKSRGGVGTKSQRARVTELAGLLGVDPKTLLKPLTTKKKKDKKESFGLAEIFGLPEGSPDIPGVSKSTGVNLVTLNFNIKLPSIDLNFSVAGGGGRAMGEAAAAALGQALPSVIEQTKRAAAGQTL
jgi:hypothetical protein